MTLNNEQLFDNIDISYKILDVFLENEKLYEYYKKEVLTYIFSPIFREKYNQIDDEFKDDFFNAVQDAYKVYIKEYGLYEDIAENIDKSVLDFFKFDDIADEILNNNP